MRKLASLLAMLVLFTTLAIAQTRTVSGRVVDAKGAPIPFASVKVKGTETGVSADVNGSFSLKANKGDILEVSAIGLKPSTITVGDETVLSVSMVNDGEQSLSEVLVTSAYDTKRTARSVSYNAQTITDDQLNTIRQTDINNAMAGKISGIQVRSQSSVKLGSNGYSSIRLRGESDIQSGSSVLYVVDGNVVPTASAGDINPDDIADLTVLQGPGAAALFGPLGANGAIVITTKTARKGAKGVGVELNIGVTFDKIYIQPNYQNSYAGGGAADLIKFTWKDGMPDEWKALDGKYHHDYADDASWGPRMVGQEYIPWYAWYGGTQYSYKTAALTPQEDNAKDFYNTGVTLNNNVSFSKAGDNYNVRLSYTNLDIKGLIPTSSLKRNNLNLNTTIDITSRLTLGSHITYQNQVTNGQFDDGYANNSQGSFNQWFHRDLDMNIMKELRGLKTPSGIAASWNHKNPNTYLNTDGSTNELAFLGGNYWYNFYTYFDNVRNINNRDRLFGDISLTYKITNDLRVKGSYVKQQLTTFGEDKTFYALESSATQTGIQGYYGTRETYSNRENFQGLVSYGKKFGDFAVNANLGFDIMRSKYKDISANTNNGLNVPDFFALANSKNPITYGNYRENEKSRAGFVRGDVGYKNFLFAEFAVRKDYFSVLPVEDNGIVSKSVGASFVFSDLLKNDLPFLSYGKLRASWGEVPRTIAPYVLGFNYGISNNQWDGNLLMATPGTLVDPNIRGAVTTQREIGLDLRFLKNRIGFSATYWDGTIKDIPLNISVNGASGFTSKLINAGEIEKKGVDLQFMAVPIRTTDMEWTINATWAKLIKNQIVKLAPDLNRVTYSSGTFAGTYAAYVVNEVGKPWGQLFGPGIKRINGKPVLGSNGKFVREAEVNFGSVLPDYTGGIQSSFSFKNFIFNANLDYQVGGKFYSLSSFWGDFSGLTAKTATINDKGNPVRDAVADGGGVHVFGVDADEKDVDYYLEAQDYYHQFQGSQISEASIYDLTYLKLREVSLGYKLDVKKIGLDKIFTGATFSLVARNPWLIYAKTKDFDPSEISNTYGENGQFPGTRSLGVNLKFGF
ncbi:MAG: SusC/RagA family TonB-linked outer membrane protein [Chitinophagaceae bacterium]